MSEINSSLTTSGVSGYDCVCLQDPSTTIDARGNVVFENANYTISVNDRGEVKVFNKETGENYRVWGDPHVNIDGEHAFDFWGQTTFVLDDGTKVTIETTPWRGNENMTISSKVTITDGDYGVHITGVDDNVLGDLSYQEFNGYVLDAVVRDGNTLYENPVGQGFIVVDEWGNLRQVDQSWINRTDELKGNEFVQPFANLIRLYAGIAMITFSGAFLSGFALGNAVREATQPPNPFILNLGRVANA